MPLALPAKASLASRAARTSAAGSSSGLRKIDFTPPAPKGGIGGRLTRFFGGALRFTGTWAFRIAGWLNLSITGVWDWLVERGYELAYFDWNQTDAELRESLAMGLEGLARSAGGIVGGSIGWLLSAAMGFGVSLVFPVIGGTLLAKWVAGQVLAEGAVETTNKLTAFVGQAINLTGRYAAIETYISTRRLLLGEEAGNRVAEPWTIAGEIEERVQRIPNRYLRAFVEGAIEDGVESIIEGGYVVAQELETAWAARNGQFEPDRGLYVKPDKDSNEQFYLKGKQAEVRERALDLLDKARILGNRDIGYYVGQIEDPTVIPQVQRRALKVHFRHKDRPPYRQSDPKFRKGEFSIPDVRTGLSWREIKSACRPFTAGRHRVTAFLDNGRQMTVFAVSGTEGKQKIKELLTLSTATVVRWSHGELEAENVIKRWTPQVLYPWKATLSVKTPASPSGADRIDPSGKAWDLNRYTARLYVDQEPDDFPAEF